MTETKRLSVCHIVEKEERYDANDEVKCREKKLHTKYKRTEVNTTIAPVVVASITALYSSGLSQSLFTRVRRGGERNEEVKVKTYIFFSHFVSAPKLNVCASKSLIRSFGVCSLSRVDAFLT